MAFLEDLQQVLKIRSLDERISDATKMLDQRVSLENNPDLRTFAEGLEWFSPSSGVAPMMGLFFTPKVLKQVGILGENIPQMGKLNPQLTKTVQKVQEALGDLFGRVEDLKVAGIIRPSDHSKIETSIKGLEDAFQEIAGKPVEIDVKNIINPITQIPKEEGLTGLLSFSQELLNVGDLVRNNDIIKRIKLGSVSGGFGSWNNVEKILRFDPSQVGAGIQKGVGSNPVDQFVGPRYQNTLAHELGHAAENRVVGDTFGQAIKANEPMYFVLSDDYVKMIEDVSKAFSSKPVDPSFALSPRQAITYGGMYETLAPMKIGDSLSGVEDRLFSALKSHGTGTIPEYGYGLGNPAEMASTLTEGIVHNPARMHQNLPQATPKWLQVLEDMFGWIPGSTPRR